MWIPNMDFPAVSTVLWDYQLTCHKPFRSQSRPLQALDKYYMLLLSAVACESLEGKNLLYVYILKYGLE